MTLIFTAIVLMACSCEKDDPVVPEPQTLEEQYPEWVNLSWVSTDSFSEVDTYPRLEITIVGDVLHVTQLNNSTGGEYNGSYSSLTISGTSFTIEDDGSDMEVDPTIVGTILSNDGIQISLRTKGLSTTSHDYVLQIN